MKQGSAGKSRTGKPGAGKPSSAVSTASRNSPP